MASEENKTLIRRFFDEGLSAGNMTLIDQMLDTTFTLHTAPPGLPPGPAGF